MSEPHAEQKLALWCIQNPDAAAAEIERLRGLVEELNGLSATEQTCFDAVVRQRDEARNQLVNVTEALKRLIEEFSDYHYVGCPAGDGSGSCGCYAGIIVNQARDELTLIDD